jgi:hypothetical protein
MVFSERGNRPGTLVRVSGVLLSILVVAAAGVWAGEKDGRDVDLRVAGMLDVHPPLPNPGDDVEINVWVENRGADDALDVLVYFYEDGRSFDREVVDVRAGDGVDIRVQWTADEGDHYLSVMVDPGGEYDDERGDNRAGTWVTVR